VIAKASVNPFVEVPVRVTRAFAAFTEHGRVRVAATINGRPLHAMLVPTNKGAHRLYVNEGCAPQVASVHLRKLFDRIRAMVDERGPTTMIVDRDRVAFMVKVRFCGVMPKRDHIELTFWFTRREDDPYFRRSRPAQRTRTCPAPRSGAWRNSTTACTEGSTPPIA